MIYVLDRGKHPPEGKADTLVREFQAHRFPEAPGFLDPYRSGFVTVCVVTNAPESTAPWEAAGVAVVDSEYQRWGAAMAAGDNRPMSWLKLSVDALQRLTGRSIRELIDSEAPPQGSRAF